MNQMNFPASEPNDSDDVTLALETAEALWNRGDPNEALRWLRRAAEAAGDSGDDLRAVVLAKAVAELNASGSESAPKHVKPPPLPPQASHGSSSSGAAPHGINGSSADTDYPLGLKGGVKGVSKAPPAPPAPPSTRKPAPAKPSAPPSARQQTASKSLHPPPTPAHKAAARALVADDGVLSSADASFGTETTPLPTSVRFRALRPSAPASRHDAKPAKHSESANGAVHKSGAARTFARAALKVYVLANARAGDKLEVHVLHEGEQAPAGAALAMLVPLQRGTKLFE